MSKPRNTAADANAHPTLGLFAAQPESIEASERAGGQQMLKSTVIPTEMQRFTTDDLVKFGFIVGDVHEDDPIFRDVTLPPGWTRGDGDNDYGYWTYILDDKGRRRFAIFYKAAFYDRSAHIGIEARFTLREHWDATTSDFMGWHEFTDNATGEVPWKSDEYGQLPETRDRDVMGAYCDKKDAAATAGEEWADENHPDWRDAIGSWLSLTDAD